jgi:hypothetical protein
MRVPLESPVEVIISLISTLQYFYPIIVRSEPRHLTFGETETIVVYVESDLRNSMSYSAILLECESGNVQATLTLVPEIVVVGILMASGTS